MTSHFNIAVLPGDGIGVDVTREALRALGAIERQLDGVKFSLEEQAVGAAEYLRNGDPLPMIALEAFANADAMALHLVRKPQTFDVIVTENMFGDILSDLAGGLVGGMGMAPSSDIGDACAEFQPSHPAWRVVQIHRDVPERHVMPPPLRQLVVDAAGPAAAGTATFAARVGIENHINVRNRLVQAVADGFQNETGEILHPAEECFNSELNGGCGVVCCAATPSNARGRHSQALRCEKNQKVLPCKTHSGPFAKPAASVKRAGDINPVNIKSGLNRPAFYATRPLDRGEERATNDLHASNNRR